MSETCTRLPGTVWPACRCTDCRQVSAKLAKRLRNNALGDDRRAAAWAVVARWESDGVSPGLIADMTGLTTRGADALLASVRAGKQHRIYHRTVDAIIEAGKRDIEGRGLLNACGSRRRLQALAVMGWPLDVVGDRTGVDATALAKVRRGVVRRTHPHVAKAIKETYDDLWNEDGPSKLAASRARSSRWAPPLAWDDDTIDNPGAQPNTGQPTKRIGGGQGMTPEAVAEDTLWLLEHDPLMTATEIARRLGYADKSGLQNALARGGRQDLLARLARNAGIAA